MGKILSKKKKKESAPEENFDVTTNEDLSLGLDVDMDFEVSDEFADIIDDLDVENEPDLEFSDEPIYDEQQNDDEGLSDSFEYTEIDELGLDELDEEPTLDESADFSDLSDFELDNALLGENDENIAQNGENGAIFASETETSSEIYAQTPEEDKCPHCNATITPNSTFCSSCGNAIKEIENIERKSPLLSKAKDPVLIHTDEIDFSDAILGESNIVIKTEKGYKALTKVETSVAYTIDCNENMAKVLVADHILCMTNPDLDTKIMAYKFLKEQSAELIELYGTDDLSAIYNDDVEAVLEFANLDKTLLSLPLTNEVLRIFAKTTKKNQKIIADCIKEFYDTYMTDELIISKPTALEISMDVTPENIRKTLAEEARIYFILKGLM